MVSDDFMREHLLNMLSQQQKKKADLEASIQSQIEEIEKNITAIETTLALYEVEPADFQKEKNKIPVTANQLRLNASNINDALEYIAKQTGGTVYYGDARDLLILSGISRGKRRNVGSHIYRIMNESPDWERIGPGIFRLLKLKPNLFTQPS